MTLNELEIENGF